MISWTRAHAVGSVSRNHQVGRPDARQQVQRAVPEDDVVDDQDLLMHALPHLDLAARRDQFLHEHGGRPGLGRRV
jgi:hypothetical protein